MDSSTRGNDTPSSSNEEFASSVRLKRSIEALDWSAHFDKFILSSFLIKRCYRIFWFVRFNRDTLFFKRRFFGTKIWLKKVVSKPPKVIEKVIAAPKKWPKRFTRFWGGRLQRRRSGNDVTRSQRVTLYQLKDFSQTNLRQKIPIEISSVAPLFVESKKMIFWRRSVKLACFN